MPQGPTIFADGLMEAGVTHGVARLTLAQTGGDGKPAPAGQLIVPLVQLPALANALVGLLRQVEARVKEAQAPGAAAKPTGPAGDGSGTAEPEEAAAPPPTLPGAFRFGGG